MRQVAIRAQEASDPAIDRRMRDLLIAQRLVGQPNATHDLLRWLARRTGVSMRIVDPAGVVRHQALGGVGNTRRSDIRHHDGHHDYSIGLGAGGENDVSAGTLQLVGEAAAPRRGVVLADVVRLLGWAWRTEQSTIDRTRPIGTNPRSREAILRLLVGGHTSAARDVAEAMGFPLPDFLGVLVVTFPEEQRRAGMCGTRLPRGEGIWAAPDPSRPDHVVVLVAADPAERPLPTSPRGRARTQPPQAVGRVADRVTLEPMDEFAHAFIGASDVVALEHTADAYERAFRALCRVRGAVERSPGYDERGTPEWVIGNLGAAWARGRLAPLIGYRPTRRGDPTSDELTDTLATWLRLGGSAARRLHIHRNTLSGRLKVVEELLRADLDSLASRAELSLALRILDISTPADGPAPPGAGDHAPVGEEVSFGDLPELPHLRDWARRRLRPVLSSPSPDDLKTLRVWLGHDARIAPTAVALDISGPGTRKRLVRIQERLGTEVIGRPATHIDLWLALWIHDHCDRAIEHT